MHTEQGHRTTLAIRAVQRLFFSILTKQGPHAPGGAKSYVGQWSDDRGIASLLIPADTARPGVMTFMVVNQELLYERILVPDTAKIAGLRRL